MASKRKKRILHVLKSSIYSGAENVILTMIDQLKDEYEFGYLASEGTIRGVLEERGIHAILLKNYTRKNVKQAIENFKPDIVHAHDFTASVYCASIKGGKNSFKLISQLHYDPPWTSYWNLKTIMYLYCSRKIDKVLTVSMRSFQHMIFSRFMDDKHLLLRNAINTEEIITLGGKTKAEYKSDLLFVGRLVKQKDPERFICIAADLIKNGIPLKCIMIGEGELRESCARLITQLGIRENITMLGFKKNPYVYMKNSKILCMTSAWEGYGLVVLEANTLGIPAIAFRTSGTEEVLEKDAEELCDTENEMRRKIRRLIEDEKEYEKWKYRALNRANKIIKLDQYKKQLELIYQELV